MKLLTSLAVLITMELLSSCGHKTLATSATLKNSYDANHCEIFVDKVVPHSTTHSMNEYIFYVKVLPSRLDSPIKEVGFHTRKDGSAQNGPLNQEWTDYKLTPHFGASDYFYLYLPVSSDHGTASYQGVFYVRTLNNTTYWLNSAGQNFTFNARTFDNLVRLGGRPQGYADSPEYGLATQTVSALRSLNPNRCY